MNVQSPQRDRAQTTIDFGIGVTVFLIALVFVFTFVPGILEPFEEGPQEQVVVADRLAAQLAEGSLAAPDQPYVLERDCTNDFFNESVDADPVCRYDKTADLGSGDTLNDRVGVGDRQSVNVTIEGELNGDGVTHVLCWDNDDDVVAEEPNGTHVCGDDRANPDADSDVLYTIGKPVPENSVAVVTARRTVSIDGKRATLLVRVWR